MENEEKVLTENNENPEPVSVVVNGEERSYSPLEIGEFIAKSEKFDLIDKDYGLLKSIADKNGLAVGDFLNSLQSKNKEERKTELLDKCSGDEDLADYILELEEKNTEKTDTAFEELKRYFPDIKDIGEIPEEVIKSASVKGSNLTNEYLRYLQTEKLSLIALQKNNEQVSMESIGSQKEALSYDYDPAKLQFIKGIWNR